MYENLENAMKPAILKKGRPLKLTIMQFLLCGIVIFIFIKNGTTWENDKSFFLLYGFLPIIFLVGIFFSMTMFRKRIGKLFDVFTEEQLQQMNQECGDKTPIGKGIFVTSHALVFEGALIPISDIVWIYESHVTQRLFHRRIGPVLTTINSLNIVDKRKKRHTGTMSIKFGPWKKLDPQAFQEFKEQLLQINPRIYFGGSEDIWQMYRKDFAEMVAHVEENSIQTHRS